MLTKLIVASYAWLVELALWCAIALAAVAGYRIALPVLFALGVIPAPEIPWQLLGAVVASLVTLLVLAVFVGPLLILMDIRRTVRSILLRMDREQDRRRSFPSERKEPVI